MTYSEAVRYMMDQCDKHGLHHEVLTEFIEELNILHATNERRCRQGEPQIPPDFADMAHRALLEWDI